MFNFLIKLLQRDPGVISLLAKDPFQVPRDHHDENASSSSYPPAKYIRILLYRYTFHKPKLDDDGKREEDAPYWNRQLVGRVYPRNGVATIASLQTEIRLRQSR